MVLPLPKNRVPQPPRPQLGHPISPPPAHELGASVPQHPSPSAPHCPPQKKTPLFLSTPPTPRCPHGCSPHPDPPPVSRQTPLDLCRGAPCQHGGQCRQTGATVTCLCPPPWTGSACDVPNVTCAVAAARRGQVWGTGNWEDWEMRENGVSLPVWGTGRLENRVPYWFGGLGRLEGAWMLGFLPSLG